MEEEIDDILICRYELGVIINENRHVIMYGNDLESITEYYEKTINKYINKDDKSHIIIFIYDYDKNTNINYYDSEVD